MSKGVTIYFMRHAQTYLNKYNRMQGWADAPLTPEGEADVLRSARGLADVDFQAVYTSDLQRTVKTAEIVLANNNYANDELTIEKRPEFREVFFGSLEGLPAQEIWDRIGQEVSQDQGTYSSFLADDAVKQELNLMKEIDPYHDAEDFMTFWMRVELGLIDVITKHRESDKTILIVSHGMTIRNMIHELIPGFQIDGLLDNASVSIVRYQNGLYHLEAYNQTDHFISE
ncbi:histidine phosphatase family protein [Aerococcus kribbianus]|uniref:Histidine phosphatase family protein n=1 Tax=Aerococcus kribbianus TaxID=2999064 RepID=A0A9X3FND2_9LACT|nr:MULTISPECIES: histidine phosphatase family protein [unclassified Aerococcus]MCZ0716948.1 histidine phosphatase family protein [Aerococcus sp. YH-aer221]MCZ0725236.1 histidine phosphatase family protein [Aerococcus sp. YH-aer222]